MAVSRAENQISNADDALNAIRSTSLLIRVRAAPGLLAYVEGIRRVFSYIMLMREPRIIVMAL